MNSSDRDSGGSFAEALKKNRIRAGLSQSKLASLSGISQAFISNLERGPEEPNLSNLRALAGALKVPPTVLISPPSTETVSRAMEAGLAVQEAGQALHLPDTVIQLAQAQALGRAVTAEGHAKE